MNELLNHLTNDHFGSYYLDEITGYSDYNHLLAYVYLCLEKALNEGADKFEATARTLTWSRNGKTLHKFRDTLPDTPGSSISYADQMREILAKDPIMQKWTRVVSDTKAGVVCEFLS